MKKKDYEKPVMQVFELKQQPQRPGADRNLTYFPVSSRAECFCGRPSSWHQPEFNGSIYQWYQKALEGA